jgi:hypothetical protein
MNVIIRNRISGNVVEVPAEKLTPENVGLIIKGQIIASVAGFIVGTLMILRGSFMAENPLAADVAYRVKVTWFEVESSSIGVLLMACGIAVLILSYFWVRVTPASVTGTNPPATTPKQ